MENRVERQSLKKAITEMLEYADGRQLRCIYIFIQKMIAQPKGEKRD